MCYRNPAPTPPHTHTTQSAVTDPLTMGYYTLDGTGLGPLELDLAEQNITQIVFALDNAGSLVSIMVGVVNGCGLISALISFRMSMKTNQ